MNSKQLVVFREVMRTGSFSEASRILHRTQPAISAMIASLEAELGYKLFLRHSGRLIPVPEAHYLFEEANEILERLRNVEQNMSRIGNLEQGELRILCMPGPSVILVPQLATRFLKQRRDVRLTLLTRSSLQVRHLVATQKFDLGLADLSGQAAEDSNLLRFEPVTYECVCALPEDDPLASRPVITPQDLRERDIAALFAAHSTYSRTAEAFASQDVPFRPRFETQYFYPLLSFVEAGLACAIIDPLSAESYRLSRGDAGKVTFRPFQPVVPFTAALVMPQHRPLSKLAESFAEILRDDLNAHQRRYSELNYG
ncbi:LysR substrate-binding domain-containing protein [Paracoccus aminovorans]|uniref:LysR substrate-binding domain-containing protein n=1 Tax=Paracoccus aminovorans TaxID=34004 RepID=UPI002B25B0E1|nr:LysR substrate-binding domain-containing protein [Paracoccus aminovorans]